MKQLLAAAVAGILVSASSAQAAITGDTVASSLITDATEPSVAMVQLDALEMESTRAGFAPLLAIALGITSVDLALMGFYYGVYVPYYMPQEPPANYDIN